MRRDYMMTLTVLVDGRVDVVVGRRRAPIAQRVMVGTWEEVLAVVAPSDKVDVRVRAEMSYCDVEEV